MIAIKNFDGFKESLLSATNGNMVESLDGSNQFGGCEYQSYRVYVDAVHFYNMFVIYNFATNTYDVALETECCGVSTLSRKIKTQKALIESVVAWISCNHLRTKKIDRDSEEYTDRCTESEKTETNIYVAPVPEQQSEGSIIADDNIELLRVKHVLNTKYGTSFRKHLHAIINPEWHHVSLANIDFDMLDEKRKLVFDINQILKDGIRNLYKCESHISFEVLERYVIRKCDELIRHNRLKALWFSYIARQLDEVRRNTIYLYTPYITAHRNRV